MYLDFRLFNVASGGSALASPVQLEDISVQNGVFSVELDFGSAVFDGTQLWLEIAVRDGTSTAVYSVLNPRQKLTATPFSLATTAVANSNESRVSTLEAQVASLKTQVLTLLSMLDGVERKKDPNTQHDTLTFTNMNLQIVNGSGTTDGATNGTGNLIIGYNELRGTDDFEADRTCWELEKRTITVRHKAAWL